MILGEKNIFLNSIEHIDLKGSKVMDQSFHIDLKCHHNIALRIYHLYSRSRKLTHFYIIQVCQSTFCILYSHFLDAGLMYLQES